MPARHALRLHHAPVGRPSHPRAIAAERIDAIFVGPAAHGLVRHVIHARRAARHQHVAHDPLVVHAQRGGVDEEAELVFRRDRELDQLAALARRRGMVFAAAAFSLAASFSSCALSQSLLASGLLEVPQAVSRTSVRQVAADARMRIGS